jgi:predicted nucleic acid-binding protein
MTCADSSSFIAFIKGDPGPDVLMVAQALASSQLVLAPVSLFELLSDPGLTPSLEKLVIGIPRLDISLGYWERAGRLRALLMKHKYRPKIADTLIAQSCLDHDVPLITRDQDFKPFQKLAGLRLL